MLLTSLSVQVSGPLFLDLISRHDRRSQIQFSVSKKNEFSFAIHSHLPFFSLTNKYRKLSACPEPLTVHSTPYPVPVSPLLPSRVSCSDPFFHMVSFIPLSPFVMFLGFITALLLVYSFFYCLFPQGAAKNSSLGPHVVARDFSLYL